MSSRSSVAQRADPMNPDEWELVPTGRMSGGLIPSGNDPRLTIISRVVALVSGCATKALGQGR
jgi:hypothetical protein